MQKTSTRGVQEADVWAAADALIAQGLRPTIERVRQHIGRGSPNTVSPMLESWFATLGQRLGVAAGQGEALPSSVPDPVQRLAQQLWDAAQAQAMEAAQAALRQREESAQAAEAALLVQQEQLAQREAAMQAQKVAMDQALQMAQTQAQDLSRRIDELRQQLQDRDARLEEMRSALADAARQREALQQKHGEEMQAAALERQRMAEQYAGNERHMLNEVDRARQELAAARKAAGEQERKAAARHAELQDRYEKSEQEQLELHAQLQTARNAAALAQERAADLRSLLEAQQRMAGAVADEGGALPLRRASLSAARRSMTRLKDRRGLR
ncbi:DNA-binding protein [Delftia sp. PS-11]|uniref:DNA-binding protein n=1 Tax=Delftia sp. PS-11 TaxID=2767222 RepID=UPI002454ED0D|nr:DNA-binding protein [Delftia sp. PS-11]KAJ8744109.1 DNA-binding protein [Delftia sp. PS-11]